MRERLHQRDTTGSVVMVFKARVLSGALALFFTLSVIGSTNAADAEKRFAVKGAGVAKCSAFIEAYEARSNDAYLFAGWIAGYVTALNQQVDGTFDFAPWQSTEVLMLLLRDLCGRNSESQVYQEAAKMVQILGRDRLTALSEIVEMDHNGKKAALPKDVLRKVQEQLKAKGLYDGGVDGAYGGGTRKAIEAFQTEQKIPVTGLPDQQTLLRLMYAPAQ
ncbi:MAG: peptidoglycan-binding protein [Hyphomicrobiales bacterium]|nr:peptidoglycan-binding protein [Hyphomicrobiales bacterium]